jgi:hypothetical protein
VTTISPAHVRETVEVQVDVGTWVDLDAKSIRVGLDADRVALTDATITLAGVTDEQWAALEPRAEDGLSSPRVQWRVKQYDRDTGALVGQLPQAVFVLGNDWAQMWLRSARELMSGEVVLTLMSGESMMTDKLSISTTDVPTGATTVVELVEYCLFNVFGGVTYTNAAIVGSTVIPAGDRRLRLIGNDMFETCRNELDAIGCRLSDYFGRVWNAEERFVTSATVWDFATYKHSEGAPVDADPIVTDYTHTRTRDGQFADGVLVKFDYTNDAGTRTVSYQITGAGANSKGFMKTYNRPEPADSVADQLLTRTVIRGEEITFTARNRFDVLPYEQVRLHRRRGVLEGNIRAVEWDTESGLMTVRAETGVPVE